MSKVCWRRSWTAHGAELVVKLVVVMSSGTDELEPFGAGANFSFPDSHRLRVKMAFVWLRH